MALDVVFLWIHSLHSGAGSCDTCWGDAPTEEGVVTIDGRHHSSIIGMTEVSPFEMGSPNASVIGLKCLQ